MTKIDENTLISEVLNKSLLAALAFTRRGMHCPTCENRLEETIADGAKRHNVDVAELLEDINNILNRNK